LNEPRKELTDHLLKEIGIQNIVKIAGIVFLGLYIGFKPQLNYWIGKDSAFTRMYKPLITRMEKTDYDNNPEKEWKYLIERNRARWGPDKECIIKIFRYLP